MAKSETAKDANVNFPPYPPSNVTPYEKPERAAFEHLIVLAHNACRSLDYPVALQNAITNAEKELAKWKA
jgi:hypothetical protein